MQSIFHVDIPYFEGPFGAFPSEGNTLASALGHCSVKGNGWFWGANTPNGLKNGETAESITEKLTTLESRYCNFLLNCMPNRDGLLDTLYLDLLLKIGSIWTPDQNRLKLPQQSPPVKYEVRPVSVTASSGEANDTIDASKIPGKNYYDWISDGSLPQNITFDLGEIYNGIEILQITPKHRCKPAPETSLSDGNIKHCKLYGSTDGENYKLLKEEKWEADAKMKSIIFEPVKIRYLKLEILEHEGGFAVINELVIGAFDKQPTL